MMKKFILYSVVLVILAATILSVSACHNMGNSPSPEDAFLYNKSDNYQGDEFKNITPLSENMEGLTLSKAFKFFFDGSRKPQQALPVLNLTKKSFQEDPADLQVAWLGHSSTILEIDGVRLLIDPVFGNASPIPLTVQCFQPSPIAREDLPEIDAVVISHDHYDHLEMNTIKALIPKVDLFIVPLGVGSHLKKWGCRPDQVVELDWWQGRKVKNVEIIATPSRHFSGRGLRDRNTTQWASFVFKGTMHRAFYSGDGGYDGRFEKIGKRFGPFDLTMIECGAWDKSWKDVHLMPEESVRAHLELGGKYMLPVHWGVYDLAFHNWDDPILKVSELALTNGIKLLTPQIGELCIPGTTIHSAWWIPEEANKLAAATQ